MENILKIKIFIAILLSFLASVSVSGKATQMSPNNNGRGSIPKIIGGHEATLGSVPYQVSIQFDGRHICGGSIINADFIISAAHCCAFGPPTVIFAGLNNISQPEEGAQKVTIDAIAVHPDYNEDQLPNDICILRLEKSLKLGEDTRTATIQLPPSGYSASGAANVTGWGSIEEGGPSSATLMVVQVPIITDYQCRKIYGSDEAIADSMICTGTEGKGPCDWDSGGPLVDDQGYLVGIVSWGAECAKGYPAVFTETANFADWINATVAHLRTPPRGAVFDV